MKLLVRMVSGILYAVFNKTFRVFDYIELRVSHPGLDQALIDISSLLNRLLLSGVVLNVELFGALSSCHEMYYSLIAFVTQLDC